MLESFAVRQPPSLPLQRQIILTQTVPPGWAACYVVDVEKEAQQASVLSLPIILWVTVRFDEDGETFEEIRHFVADTDGEIKDFMELDLPFLCIVEPTSDFEKVTRAALAVFDAHARDKEESDNLMS